MVVNGVMLATASNDAFALDASTGRELWHHSRPNSEGLIDDASGHINRGVAVWSSRVYMQTDNAHLLCLDARSGNLIWDVAYADWNKNYGATGAPLIVKDKVIVGTSGGDDGVRGFVAAYDAMNGKLAWRFWTIPAPGEFASDSWPGDAYLHGGGTTWMPGTYDPDLNLIFWGTSNPSPDFEGRGRPGDDLYTDCLIALDADTGKLKWHFQFTPHDLFDYDALETPVLIDAAYRGQARKLLVEANRNGFFRRSGRRWTRTNYLPAEFSRLAGGKRNGAPRFEHTAWAGQFTMPGAPGPSINIPKIPPLDVPRAITVNVADLTAHPFATSSSIGVKYIYDKNDLYYEATGILELHNLHANFALGILNGVPADSGLDLGGELGVHVHLNAHTSQNFHVNSQTKLYVPVDFSIPLGGPIPFALSFEQAAIINTGFSAKNSIMNADGLYNFTGGLKAGRFGGSWGVSVPMKISYVTDVGQSLEGLSVGINSLVLGCSLEGIVGLGVAGFTTGVYVTLTVSATVLRAPDIALACRQGTIEAWLYSGLGYAMPKWLNDAVNYVLSFFTDDRVDQVGSLLKGPATRLFHGDTSIPRGCASPTKGGA